MSIITYYYSKDKNTLLSKYFKVSEFVCKGTEKILIDTELISLLDKVRTWVGADKMIINSGYRTKAHDKAVGGSGNGQHTKGKAADVVCYKKGKIISAKEVCCAAESCGAAGIGYISASATHIDCRNGKWWGDETKGNKSISKINGCQSFYDYFGITKPNACPYAEPTVNVKRGSKGDAVKWVQWHLNNKGYACGKIDGVCGANTSKQIAHFQSDKGLMADGICGKNTREALK